MDKAAASMVTSISSFQSDDDKLDPQPFRFFDLPSEVRVCIYELLLLVPKTVDLDPTNYRYIAPRLRLFPVSRRFHEEAYRVFYGSNTFRLFPVHGRFFHTKEPLIARLPSRYRASITIVELRLGPGWTAPPKGWVVNAKLGLDDIKTLRLLKVFVECDPASDDIFSGFRRKDDFYTHYCGALVKDILIQAQSLAEFQFDAWPSVKKNSPIMAELSAKAKAAGKRVTWGPTWNEVEQVEAALSLLTI